MLPTRASLFNAIFPQISRNYVTILVTFLPSFEEATRGRGSEAIIIHSVNLKHGTPGLRSRRGSSLVAGSAPAGSR